MHRDLPNDVEQALSMLLDVAHGLDLDVVARDDGGEQVQRLSGAVDGVTLTADVVIVELLGAAHYNVDTTLTIEPELGFDLYLKNRRRQYQASRELHLPEAWLRAPGAFDLGEVSSQDPASVHAILGAVGPPEIAAAADWASPGLVRLTDDHVVIRARQLGRAGDIETHLRDAAAWTASLIAAARAFDPTDHPVMRAGVWQPITESYGGSLNFRERRFACDTPTASLAIVTRWSSEAGYHLVGTLDWPALPFDALSLTPQGERSWLRRLFLRDIEVGREAFDRAFIINAEPASRLQELVTDRVQKAALVLVDQVQGLSIHPEGARFTVADAKLTPLDASALVGAAIELGHAVTAAFNESKSAYR